MAEMKPEDKSIILMVLVMAAFIIIFSLPNFASITGYATAVASSIAQSSTGSYLQIIILAVAIMLVGTYFYEGKNLETIQEKVQQSSSLEDFDKSIKEIFSKAEKGEHPVKLSKSLSEMFKKLKPKEQEKKLNHLMKAYDKIHKHIK